MLVPKEPTTLDMAWLCVSFNSFSLLQLSCYAFFTILNTEETHLPSNIAYLLIIFRNFMTDDYFRRYDARYSGI